MEKLTSYDSIYEIEKLIDSMENELTEDNCIVLYHIYDLIIDVIEAKTIKELKEVLDDSSTFRDLRRKQNRDFPSMTHLG